VHGSDAAESSGTTTQRLDDLVRLEMLMNRCVAVCLALIAALAVACGGVDAQGALEGRVVIVDTPVPMALETPTPTSTSAPTPSPTAAPVPSSTPEPTPAPARTTTPPPTPQPTPRPVEVRAGTALVVGDGVVVRSKPSTREGAVVRRLQNLEEITILGAVAGEQWIVGDQTWAMVPPAWSRTWYQVEDGFIYGAFVFVPEPGEVSPFIQSRAPRSIEVSLSRQRLTVYVGEEAVYTASVTTGKPGYETPAGTYTVGSWGRVFNETMTSSQAAISDPAEEYHVKNVLYTQYFNNLGDALHLNYWQPESVFGAQPTSHGCVGLMLHDAQWLWLFVQPGTKLTIRA